jgi:glyoxylase-like metal-dependent hydrolase (beta-lactamase superfamily II)/ferredoxin
MKQAASLLLTCASLAVTSFAFVIPKHINIQNCRRKGLSTRYSTEPAAALHAAPKRLPDNADGVLYVNDRCIDCATCSHFAPTIFSRTNLGHHIVHTQPSTEHEIDTARAALAACPVAAIRIETSAQRHHRGEETLSSPDDAALAKNLTLSTRLNGRSYPFPRQLTEHVWYLGHHNEHSFGATPYLTFIKSEESQTNTWIMIDSPRYCQSAVETVLSLTGPSGPDYLFLTHVDDTADHEKWKLRFPLLQRIFHAKELGRNNWLGDATLEQVEILVQPNVPHDYDDNTRNSGPDALQAYDLTGRALSAREVDAQTGVVIYHTPGHSPGSISLLLKSDGVLFSGDTLGYTDRTKTLTGFPRYGRDLRLQKATLDQMEAIPWDVVAPGHGHARDYRGKPDVRSKELLDAKKELNDVFAKRRR